MNEIEIDYALAVAIGWSDKGDDPDVVVFDPSSRWTARVVVWHAEKWTTFSHKDPAVIWKIAERHNAFPKRDGSQWCALTRRAPPMYSSPHYADTAARAVALAVIGASK